MYSYVVRTTYRVVRSFGMSTRVQVSAFVLLAVDRWYQPPGNMGINMGIKTISSEVKYSQAKSFKLSNPHATCRPFLITI